MKGSGGALYPLLHGTSGLVFAYLVALASIIVGLITSRAPARRWLIAPLLAVVACLLTALVGSVLSSMLPSFIAQLLAFAFLVFIGVVMGRWPPDLKPQPKHQRGAWIEPEQRRSGTAREQGDFGLTLAGVDVPLFDETKHFKLIGTTGTGKSTAIRELLTGALGRGDRAVIADPDAAYLERFYDPKRGDVILNPFDGRSLKWDVFSEIREPYDFEQLARSLIPEGAADDRVWRDYAKTFLTAVMRQAYAIGVRETAELYRLVSSASLEELQLLLDGSVAHPFVQGGNERMFGSIRSVATSAMAALEYVARQTTDAFSVRRWIREGRGVLFLPYRADQIAALRALISTWMRIAIFEALSLPEGDARIWYVIDELDALGPIDGLKDALARLRKFGGRCVLGFQSIAQVSATYGHGQAHTLVENCGNTLILRCSASEGGGTAQFATKLIGEREIIRDSLSRSGRPTEWLSTRTTSEQRVVESAAMPSEIEQLPDLEGYLKLASVPSWRRVKLTRP